MARLSNARIQSLKPDPARVRMVGDGERLYLRVYPGGAKTWVLRSSGRVKALKTLGTFPDLTLADARRIANGERKTTQLLFGKSTVREVAKEFYSSQIEPRNKRPQEVWRYLDRDLTPILDKRIIDVTRAELATLVRNKVADGPVAANILLSITKRLFRFAVQAGVLEIDPAQLLDRSMAGGNRSARDRVLSDDEIKKLWNATAEGKGTPLGPQHRHGPLIRMLMLTGQRIMETKEARWSDIDFKKKVWHIPKERTKTGRAHWVALPDLAIETLKALPRNGDHVFPTSSTSAVQNWIGRWCDRHGITPAFTPHDLRRTMATRMNEIGIAPHVVEKILNHQMGGVMGIYNRAEYTDERIEAQQKWSNALAAIVAYHSASSASTRRSRPNLKLVSQKR